ncbi:MAG: SDR family oxidoreductase [Gammaproteobacteria bacterium]|nr:SDR family oxidoreductase [Gammaproteobacteria bacterium]
MRVLLTGATGLIGSAVARRLRKDHKVVTLGRKADLVDLVTDLADPAAVAGLDLPPSDCLVHCAGVIDEDFKADPMAAYLRATLGADALADVASRSGCRRFVYVSSTHVYGAQVGEIREDVPANPQSHYALAHFCTEQIMRRHAAQVDGSAVMLRPNAVYGLPAHPESFQRWSLIPFSFPCEAKRDGRITLRSSGLQKRNFVSTAAIADMVARCLGGDLATAAGVIHVLGTETESVYDFAQRCRRIAEQDMGRPCAVERPASSLDAPGAQIGADFSLTSRFEQQRPAEELDSFIKRLVQLC